MKTREEAVKYIDYQFSDGYECKRYKHGCFGYGLQDLRELMDFIYEGKPMSKKGNVINDNEYIK